MRSCTRPSWRRLRQSRVTAISQALGEADEVAVHPVPEFEGDVADRLERRPPLGSEISFTMVSCVLFQPPTPRTSFNRLAMCWSPMPVVS